MSERTIYPDILLKLQRDQGYDRCRIRHHPLRSDETWIAETKLGGKWRLLVNRQNDYRTFPTPEQAYIALEEWRHTPFS